jgi:hypothetical protein
METPTFLLDSNGLFKKMISRMLTYKITINCILTRYDTINSSE